jgi:hypothetical protein
MSPILILLEALHRHKFVDIKVQSIGEYVFPGWGFLATQLTKKKVLSKMSIKLGERVFWIITLLQLITISLSNP